MCQGIRDNHPAETAYRRRRRRRRIERTTTAAARKGEKRTRAIVLVTARGDDRAAVIKRTHYRNTPSRAGPARASERRVVVRVRRREKSKTADRYAGRIEATRVDRSVLPGTNYELTLRSI